MLITLISGVLFYKNLTQIKGPSDNVQKIDFESLQKIDLQVYSAALFLRQNQGADINELKDENLRIKELLDILNDINKNTPELKNSIAKIQKHFIEKKKLIDAFEVAVKDLRVNTNELIPAYNVLEKNNIKFVLDKKDFYRECILDSYMYISYSHKENENRLADDQKVLGQIISYASSPNPDIKKFAGHLDAIHKNVREMDIYLKDFRDITIAPEMKIISKFFQENILAQSQQNENLLTFMFAAIGIYLLFMIFILRKT